MNKNAYKICQGTATAAVNTATYSINVGTVSTIDTLLQSHSHYKEVPKRFIKATLERINAIKELRFEEKTKKATKWRVKIFNEWLKENNINPLWFWRPNSPANSL